MTTEELNARELHRLVGLYQIDVNGDVYWLPNEQEAVRLLNDTMHSASAALFQYASDRDSRHLDDHEDYTRAAMEQISWVLDVLHDTSTDPLASVNALLNARRIEVNDLDADCFEDGAAGHDTPIGRLMHMNRDEDCVECNQSCSYDDQNDHVPTR